MKVFLLLTKNKLVERENDYTYILNLEGERVCRLSKLRLEQIID